MKELRVSGIVKPDFLSEATIKTRPKIKVVSLSGMGDPLNTFDQKISKVLTFLGNKRSKSGHTLGIYHKDRRNVGVENVEWDACVLVDKEVKTRGMMKFQVLPETKVVSVTLTGGYDLIGPSLEYLEKVTKAEEVKTSWPLTEIYIKEGENPVTELQYLVA